jgi:hypothetical protein
LLPYLILVCLGSLLSLSAARSLSGSSTLFLVGSALLLRAILIPRAPDLSDDVWRYLWDGEVAASGISPWAHAPAEPALAPIAPELRARVAHPELPTVYPPVAQGAFLAASLFEPSLTAWKVLVTAADTSVVALLAASGSPAGAALYAFHPLPITEAAGAGHVDSLGVALMVAALLLAARGRPLSSGVAWAASVLTKYAAGVALLPLWRAGRGRFAVAGLATLAALWLAAASFGASPAGSLFEYATRWEFNAILFPAARAAMAAAQIPEGAKETFLILKESLGHPAWTSAVFPYFYAGFFARVLLALLLGAALVVVAVVEKDLWRAAMLSLAALLLASPTLHPWYLLWILPLAARAGSPALLWLASAAPISYGLLYPRPWLPPAAILAVEYVPFLWLAGRGFFVSRVDAR